MNKVIVERTTSVVLFLLVFFFHIFICLCFYFIIRYYFHSVSHIFIFFFHFFFLFFTSGFNLYRCFVLLIFNYCFITFFFSQFFIFYSLFSYPYIFPFLLNFFPSCLYQFLLYFFCASFCHFLSFFFKCFVKLFSGKCSCYCSVIIVPFDNSLLLFCFSFVACLHPLPFLLVKFDILSVRILYGNLFYFFLVCLFSCMYFHSTAQTHARAHLRARACSMISIYLSVYHFMCVLQEYVAPNSPHYVKLFSFSCK